MKAECEKSHVGMVLCFICHEPMEILLETRIVKNIDGERELQKSLCKNNIIPGHVCDKCKETYLKEGIMVMNPETGSFVVIKDEAFLRMLKDVPESQNIYREAEKKRMACAPEEVIQWIMAGGPVS